MGLLARFVPSLIPGLSALANPWVLLVIAAIAAGIWFKGYATGRGALDDYIGKQAQAAVAIAVKRGAVTERVITKYVKVKGDTQVVTQTVEKEVTKYAESNPGLCLDADWRRLHDASALNVIPGAAGKPDGQGGAPKAAAALDTVTGNYAGCNRTADRLDALQEWVREQAAVKP